MAVTNGPTPRTLSLPLSFLPAGRPFQALLVREGAAADEVTLERPTLGAQDKVDLRLPAGGGFVGRFTR